MLTTTQWIEEFCYYCRVHRHMKDGSITRYRRYLELFLEFVGNKTLPEITILDINRFIADYKTRNYSINSQRMYQVIVRMFFAFWSQKTGMEDPARDVLQIKEEIKVPRLLTPTDVIKMIYSCDLSDYIGRRNAAMIALLAGTGIRESECAMLKMGNIQMRENNFLLMVPRLKSYERQVPFGLFQEYDLVAEYFAQYYLDMKLMKRYPDNFPLFYTAGLTVQGTAISAMGIYQMIKVVAKRSKLPKWVTVHSFRHFFATYYIANGGDIMQLKELLGHALLTTTQRYVHLATLIKPDIIKKTALSGFKAPKHVSGYVKIIKEIAKQSIPQ